MTEVRPIRVLVVDDDPFSRVAIRSMVESRGNIEVEDAEGVVAAIEGCESFDPDVAIVDLDLGEGPNGLDLVEGLRRCKPDMRIVVLSTYESPRLLGVGSDRLPGDVTYLVKSQVTSADVILSVVVDEESPKPAPLAANVSQNLSDTNLEILRLVARGVSNAEIASRLFLSERAVEKAIARLIKALRVPADKTQNQRVMLAQAYFAMAGVVKNPARAD